MTREVEGKMRTIWVLHGGDYSDYRVSGVFSSRKNANLAKTALKDRDSHVDEWTLDPCVADLNMGYQRFRIVMLRDGTTEEVRSDTYLSQLEPSIWLWKRTEAVAYKGKGIPDALVAEVWAKDAKHAVKIANEHRTRMIAFGEWKP